MRLRPTPVIRQLGLMGSVMSDYPPTCIGCGKEIEESACIEMREDREGRNYHICLVCGMDIGHLAIGSNNE